ncbi:MAG: lipase [Clostridiales bacterium]|nr:lipase [Clostridiales bacterium]
MKGKKKKLWKVLGLVLLVLLVVFAGTAGVLIKTLVYPDPLVSGSGDTKIICVGDSLTFSQGVYGSRKTESFPAVLAELMGDDYQVVNYGLPNRTLLSTGNMPYTNETFAKTSLEEDADIVIIMLGSNDSKPVNWDADRFLKEYTAFVKNYQNMDSGPEVYVMLPTQLFTEPKNDGDGRNDTLGSEVIPAVRKVAERTGAGLIDLYSLSAGHPEWFADGAHPNAEGNRAVAEEIARVLKAN